MLLVNAREQIRIREAKSSRNIRLAVHSLSLTYSAAAVRERQLEFKIDRRPLGWRRKYKRVGTVGMPGAAGPQKLPLQEREWRFHNGQTQRHAPLAALGALAELVYAPGAATWPAWRRRRAEK